MASEFLKKIRKVPLWTLQKSAQRIASAPLVSDAACPRFPAIPRAFLDSRGYRSQIGQDYLVDQILLGSITNGIFVDVGAHDGFSLSNTFFFESVRGWTGLCIEPNPEVYGRLSANRKCQTEQVAIGAYQGTVEFAVVNGPDMLSGVKSRSNSRHRQRIKAEIEAVNGSLTVIEVPLRTLQSLLDAHNISNIDLLTIDTEGSELDVLRGIDFIRTRVSCIVIERNYESGPIPKFLKNNGFVRLMALAWDDIYIREDLLLSG